MEMVMPMTAKMMLTMDTVTTGNNHHDGDGAWFNNDDDEEDDDALDHGRGHGNDITMVGPENEFKMSLCDDGHDDSADDHDDKSHAAEFIMAD